jgi:hypothetical protein
MRAREFAEAGVDTVDRFVATGCVGNNFGSSVDPRFTGFVDAYGYVTAVDSAQIRNARVTRS